MIHLEEIRNRVSDMYRLRDVDLTGPRRALRYSEPRQVAYLLSSELTKYNIADIGRFYGRDHTTVLSGIKSIKAKIKADEWIAGEYANLRRQIVATDIVPFKSSRIPYDSPKDGKQ